LQKKLEHWGVAKGGGYGGGKEERTTEMFAGKIKVLCCLSDGRSLKDLAFSLYELK
jgi:hypothetical protein